MRNGLCVEGWCTGRLEGGTVGGGRSFVGIGEATVKGDGLDAVGVSHARDGGAIPVAVRPAGFGDQGPVGAAGFSFDAVGGVTFGIGPLQGHGVSVRSGLKGWCAEALREGGAGVNEC